MRRLSSPILLTVSLVAGLLACCGCSSVVRTVVPTYEPNPNICAEREWQNLDNAKKWARFVDDASTLIVVRSPDGRNVGKCTARDMYQSADTAEREAKACANQKQLPGEVLDEFAGKMAQRCAQALHELKAADKPLVLVFDAPPSRYGEPSPEHRLLGRVRETLIKDRAITAKWMIVACPAATAKESLRQASADPRAWMSITGDAQEKTQLAQYHPDDVYVVSISSVSVHAQPRTHALNAEVALQISHPRSNLACDNAVVRQDCVFHPAYQAFLSREKNETLLHDASCQPSLAGR